MFSYMLELSSPIQIIQSLCLLLERRLAVRAMDMERVHLEIVREPSPAGYLRCVPAPDRKGPTDLGDP